MKRRILAALLVLVMAMSMTTVAFAAETGTDGSAALSLEVTPGESETVVTVFLQGCDGVTNGRFVVSYDADVFTLLGVQVSDAYVVSSVNDQTAGTVALAWVGSQLTDEKTLMLTLRFEMDEEIKQDTTYTVESDGTYAGTELVEVAGDSVTVAGEADNSGENVGTGDSTMIGLAMGLAAVSACGIVVLFVQNKRRKNV